MSEKVENVHDEFTKPKVMSSSALFCVQLTLDTLPDPLFGEEARERYK